MQEKNIEKTKKNISSKKKNLNGKNYKFREECLNTIILTLLLVINSVEIIIVHHKVTYIIIYVNDTSKEIFHFATLYVSFNASACLILKGKTIS